MTVQAAAADHGRLDRRLYTIVGSVVPHFRHLLMVKFHVSEASETIPRHDEERAPGVDDGFSAKRFKDIGRPRMKHPHGSK
jgi:hypothetical protein